MTERKSVRRQSGGLQYIAALEDTEIELQRRIADTWRTFQIVLYGTISNLFHAGVDDTGSEEEDASGT